MKTNTIFVAVALCALAACGGSGTGSNQLSFSQLQSSADNIAAQFEDDVANSNYTPIDALPFSGVANYTGVVGLGEGDVNFVTSAPVLGQIDLDVNLGTDRISGDATNFVIGETNENLTGTLDVDMSLDRNVDIQSFYSWEGTMIGDLRNEANAVTAFDLSIAGDLYRADRGLLFGVLSGTAENINGIFDVDGVWVATD